MEYRRGEIYEYETVGKLETKKALVVSADFRAGDRYINIIILIDEPKGRINVPIVCEGMMYADCGMVSFATNDRLGRYIRTATADEMCQIDEGIAKCLDLNFETVEKIVEVPVERVSEVPAPVGMTEELAEAKAEARIFKNLYEKLLEKMMG